MSRPVKIAVIGSGSTYSPELINGILDFRKTLSVYQIDLMDIDPEKLKIVGGLCQRMVKAAGMECNVRLTADLDEALTGADFVITQIRVGKLPARVLDEKIPLKYGLIGQETTGIGGFFKALRTIPQLFHIADRMQQLCPEAFMINFTNPSGIVTQALLTQKKVKAVGLCNVPINMVSDIRERMGMTAQQNVQMEYVGLNHLSWVTRIVCDGVDRTAEAIAQGITATPMKNIKACGFTPDCIRAAGAIPSPYLEYFYNKNHKLEMAQQAEKCRGEICIEIEKQLLSIYQKMDVTSKPAQLEQRGGSKYSLAAISLINSIANDSNDVHIVNCLNQGALAFMDEDDVVEIACTVNKDGVHPIPLPGFHNPHIEAMMRTIKAYERATVRAAITGDDDEALRALMINPLVFDFTAAKQCFEEMKQAHKKYLPQFYKGEACDEQR